MPKFTYEISVFVATLALTGVIGLL